MRYALAALAVLLCAGGAAAVLELLAGLVEQPVSDGDDEARLLGEGDEVLGSDEPALLVRPADERLEPLDAS